MKNLSSTTFLPTIPALPWGKAWATTYTINDQPLVFEGQGCGDAYTEWMDVIDDPDVFSVSGSDVKLSKKKLNFNNFRNFSGSHTFTTLSDTTAYPFYLSDLALDPRDSEQTNIPFYISSSGHICRPFHHKILDVALLRLRVYSIRNDKYDPNPCTKLGISVYSKSLNGDGTYEYDVVLEDHSLWNQGVAPTAGRLRTGLYSVTQWETSADFFEENTGDDFGGIGYEEYYWDGVSILEPMVAIAEGSLLANFEVVRSELVGQEARYI